MPDYWMDVDAALTEVPVNILPLVDATDFKAIEDAVAYNAAGMALFWHFVTTAGIYNNGLAVTPTTGGDYDWTDHGTHGIYTIEIPASGGASANNATEGFGWFTGVATGVLPWRGPTIGFRDSEINDLLIDASYSATRGLAGTALPDAAADAALGLPISTAGSLDLDAVFTAVNSLDGTKIPDILSLTNILAQAVAANVTHHLDHFFAANYDPAAKPGTGTALMNELVENDGGVSRFTANALEQAPSVAGANAILMQSTTVTVSTQTSMVLAAGSADNDAYNGRLAVIKDTTTAEQKSYVRISDYTGSTKTVTFEAAAAFTVVTGDTIDILAITALTAAEANAQALAANVTHGLDHIVSAAVVGADITDDSIIAQIASASGTADWDTYNNTTDSLEATSNTILGVAGAGANLVTITITDTEGVPNDLENATVVLSEGGNSYTATTDVDGEAVFQLNSATYTYVVAKSNYAGASGSIVISTNPQTQTYAMAVNGSPSPAAAGFSNGSLICYDEAGATEAGVEIYVQLHKGTGVAGKALDTKIRNETSPSGGVVTFTNLVRLATYRVWRGPDPAGTGGGLTVAAAGAKATFTVPDAATFDITEVLGADE